MREALQQQTWFWFLPWLLISACAAQYTNQTSTTTTLHTQTALQQHNFEMHTFCCSCLPALPAVCAVVLLLEVGVPVD